MKKIVFLLSLIFGSSFCIADVLNETTIQTKDEKCAIHYLTTKSKKLWSIEVNEHYCKEGWVHGFATVFLKDSLDRPNKTLEGYFEKGYWVSDFPGEITGFRRMSIDPKKQNFVFQIANDDELEVAFYMSALSQEKDGEYGPFEICPSNPLVIVEHQPSADFKISLFQSRLIKKVRELLLARCPEVKKFEVWGLENIELLPRWFFQGHFDIETEEMTLNYATILENDIPRPSELRHEQGENLITIHPKNYSENKDSLKETDPKNEDMNLGNETKSAVDLALLTKVLQHEVKGKTIVYVATKRNDYSFETIKPLPLILRAQEALSVGWYLIDSIFQPDEDGILVQVLSAKKCKLEWCADEK